MFRLGLILLLACQSTLAAGIFRSGHSGEPDSLDPHRAQAGTAVIIANDLFEGLVTLNARGRPVPGIAERWVIGKDGTRYQLYLRKGLTWSDGEPLTAADVVYSMRRLVDPATRAGVSAAQMQVVRGARDILRGKLPPDALGVTALNPSTIAIQLERPAPYFIYVLAYPGLVPVPAHVIERHGNGWTQPGVMVSNGAFMLTEWIPQERVRVVRNPRFREADLVSLDEVHYFPLDDLSTGLRKFRAGEIDAMVNFPPDRLDWIRANMPNALRLSPSLGIYVYVFNNARPPFDDPRVRRALSMSVDREAIANRLIKTGDRPAYSVVPPGIENYFPPINDPQGGLSIDEKRRQARRLLSDAGFTDSRPLTVSVLYHTSEEHKKVAIAVASMWQSIGVRTQLRNAERSVVNAAMKDGDFEIVRAAWFSLLDDPYGFLSYFETGSPSNFARYHNPTFDQAVLDANYLLEPLHRGNALREAEQLLMADQPVLPILYYVSRRLVADRVRGWEIANRTAFHPARYLSVTGPED